MKADGMATIVLCVLLSSAAGCLVGIAIAARVAGRIVRKHLPDFPEFIAVRKIDLTSNVTIEEEGSTTSLVLSTTGPELTALTVENWLGKRGLMMTPKGKEFTVKRGERQ